MKTQVYLLLETAYESLVDAGLLLEDVNNSDTGVYVGGCFSDMHSFELSDPEGMTGYEHTGCAKAMFSNRISYSFNLHGPSMTIDTACSSSLVALVQAYNDLQSGRVKTALVGGSSLILDPSGCVGFNKFKMLAPDGHCKSFDKSGDGFARADGIVTMFLTTDPAFIKLAPHAKIVGADTNTCGAHEKGITYPSGAIQMKLYERVFKDSLKPSDVHYIEAHGTGTKAGVSPTTIAATFIYQRSLFHCFTLNHSCWFSAF
jgi:fatty acid synthase